jgi:hypothetical protein
VFFRGIWRKARKPIATYVALAQSGERKSRPRAVPLGSRVDRDPMPQGAVRVQLRPRRRETRPLCSTSASGPSGSASTKSSVPAKRSARRAGSQRHRPPCRRRYLSPMVPVNRSLCRLRWRCAPADHQCREGNRRPAVSPVLPYWSQAAPEEISDDSAEPLRPTRAPRRYRERYAVEGRMRALAWRKARLRTAVPP